MKERERRPWVVATVWILRLLLGGLFILSGIAKTTDLYGTVFKIEEYFAVWGWTVPRSLTMVGAMILSGSEFVLGLSLTCGSFRRASVWLLLLMMTFMLPLTLYIYIADPVSDCGCFGDFWVLGNGATFLKNVCITAGLVILARYNRCIPGVYSVYSQWITVVPMVAYLLIVGLYGYNVQPMLDFRSFPVGRDLLEDADNESLPGYEYQNESGETKVFAADELPGDGWTFVRRIEPVKTNSVTEFIVTDADGEDVTEQVVTGSGRELLLVVNDQLRGGVSWTYFLNELADTIQAHGGRMSALVAGGERNVEFWRDISMPEYNLYAASSTMLKELARGDLAMVMLDDGVIVRKTSLAFVDPDEFAEVCLDPNLKNPGPDIFRWLTITLIVMLLGIFLLDGTGRLISYRLAHRRKRHESQDSKKQTEVV